MAKPIHPIPCGLLVLTFGVFFACEARSESVPAGRYEGHIWSNSLRPGTTNFHPSSDGVTGNYEFEVAGDIESGTLRTCRETVPLNWRCEWQDAYGTGLLEMEFSADYSAFEGIWSDDNNPPSLGLEWNGARVATATAER